MFDFSLCKNCCKLSRMCGKTCTPISLQISSTILILSGTYPTTPLPLLPEQLQFLVLWIPQDFGYIWENLRFWLSGFSATHLCCKFPVLPQPKDVRLDSDHMTGELTELSVMFMKPVWDNLCFLTWCIIMPEAAVIRWVHCGHKGIFMVSNHTHICCCIQMKLDWYCMPSMCAQKTFPTLLNHHRQLELLSQVRLCSLDSFRWCQILTAPCAYCSRYWDRSDQLFCSTRLYRVVFWVSVAFLSKTKTKRVLALSSDLCHQQGISACRTDAYWICC